MKHLYKILSPKNLLWHFLGLYFLSIPCFAKPSCSSGWEGPVAEQLSDRSLPTRQNTLKRKDCEKEWTLLVYMAADNNLSPFAIEDLLEMEKPVWNSNQGSATSSHIDVLTQLDSQGDHGVQRRQMYSYKKSEDNLKTVLSPVVEELPENDSANPQNLYDFLKWGLDEYPSRHVMVVIWGHGQGWTSGIGSYGGIAFDDTSNSKMSIQEMAHVIHSYSKSERPERGIDILASDACLMQSLEVLSELAGDLSNLVEQSVDYVVGSTEKQSAYGLPYHSILKFLNHLYMNDKSFSFRAKTRDDAYLVASALPALTKQNFTLGPSDAQSERSLTLSSVSIIQLKQTMMPNMYNLARVLKKQLASNDNDLIEWLDTLSLLISYEGENRDLGAWTQSLDNFVQERLHNDLSYLELSKAVDAFREALSATVIAYSLGSRYSEKREQLYLLGFKAVSMWVPDDLLSYQLRRNDFLNSNMYRFHSLEDQKNSWAELQDYIYGFLESLSYSPISLQM